MNMTFASIRQWFSPESSSKKTAIRGVTWLAGDKILKLAVSLFTGALVARYLEPQKYGTLSSLTAFAGLFSPFVNMGLNNLLLRDIATHPEKEKKFVDSAIILKTLGGVFSFVFAVSVALLFNQKQYEPFLLILAIFHFFFYSFEALELWFLAKHEQKKPVIAGQTSFFITSALRVLAVIFNLGLPAIIFTYTLDIVLGGVFVYFYARKYLKFRFANVKYDKETVNYLFKEAIPLILANLGATIYMKIDKVIMPWLTTSFTIGIYAAATRLSELWYFIPLSINTVFSPLIAEAKNKHPEIYEKRIRKALIVVNIVTVGIALMTTIAGPLVINIVFGNKYLEATQPLLIHIWSLPFASMGLMVDIWLLNQHLQKIQVARTFTTALINIGLNVLLVPTYGASGAATATLIAYTYPGFFANLLDKRTREIFWVELQSMLPTRSNLKLLFEK